MFIDFVHAVAAIVDIEAGLGVGKVKMGLNEGGDDGADGNAFHKRLIP